MEQVSAVILAAGDGKRMKSSHPKVMSEVLFKPMISWVTDNCLAGGISGGCVVLGAGADEVSACLPEQFIHVLQPERKGTGHAASMAQDFLHHGGFSHVVVLNGDAPLLFGEELQKAYAQHIADGNSVTVISAHVENPLGYGRVIRDGNRVSEIVEEKDCDDAQRAVDEINSGAYWFETAFLLDYFQNMRCDNAQNEYYMTDCIAYAVKAGRRVGAYAAPSLCVLGANSRADLQYLNMAANRHIQAMHMEGGVNIPFPQDVVIGPDVQIGPDTTILPGSILRGVTQVGSDCEIGPNSHLQDAAIGDKCVILSSYVDCSRVRNGAHIGPMSNVRPNCDVGERCKVGDFVELKNSTVGEATSVAHLTYLGDTDMGARCNVGCGVVTVNYDGNKKYRTVVGDEAFLGCNTNLVAPVKVGNRVYAAAGTTVTEDVPDDALVIGRARQVIKENWVSDRGRYTKYNKKK